jgi:HAD superfamily hydrolase (TIGR01509 family)
VTKAIIFDVDGTLSETEETHRKAFNRAFEHQGFPWHWDRPTYRRLLQVTGGKERIRHFAKQDDAVRLLAPDFDDFVRELHGKKTSIYTSMIADGAASLRPGIRELILDAEDNGYRLAISTTTSAPNVAALLFSAFGDDGAGKFEVICGGDSVANKKPAPDIYLLTLEQLGLRPEDCIAIEDSRNGLLSAYRAGIPTVVTPSIYTDDQDFDEAAWVIDDLGKVGLMELIENVRKASTSTTRRTA